MAKLDPLIRVRKHTVEEKQKFLATLLAKEEELLKRKPTRFLKLRPRPASQKNTHRILGFRKASHNLKTP